MKASSGKTFCFKTVSRFKRNFSLAMATSKASYLCLYMHRNNDFIISADPLQTLLENSIILDCNIGYAKQLVEWLEDRTFGWKLCYRASLDGWKGEDFHRRCDDVGATVTLVECGTNVFGGYTDRSWKGIPDILSYFMHCRIIQFV